MALFKNQHYRISSVQIAMRMCWAKHSCFSDFVFNIRLIRLGFLSKNKKILYFNPQPTDSQPGVLTTTPQSQLWVGDTAKLSVTFSHAWLILVEFT